MPGQALPVLQVRCKTPEVDLGSRGAGYVSKPALVRARRREQKVLHPRTHTTSSISKAGRNRKAVTVGDNQKPPTLPSSSDIHRTTSPSLVQVHTRCKHPPTVQLRRRIKRPIQLTGTTG